MTISWKKDAAGENATDGDVVTDKPVTIGRAWRVTNQLSPKFGQFQAGRYVGTVEHDLGAFPTMEAAKEAIGKALAEPS